MASRVRCRRCADGVAHTFPHGANAYREHRCRCDVCTEDHRLECWRYNQRAGLALRRERYNPQKRQADYLADIDRISERNREYAKRNRERMSQTQRAWWERNPGAKAAAYKRRMAKRGGVVAANNRKAWTAEADSVVMSNQSVLEIAHHLGRTYASVESRRRQLRKEQAA